MKTIADVEAALSALGEMAQVDEESAHASEDELWRSVLGAIADGSAEDAPRMAALALTSWDISFSRWYA